MNSARVQYFKPGGINGLEVLTCQDVDYCFPPHLHDAYCIWLNTRGGEHYFHSGNSNILQPGSFGIIAPSEVHSNRACENKDRELLTFYLDPQQLQKIAAQCSDKMASEMEFRTGFHDDPGTLQNLVALSRLLSHSSSILEQQSAFLDVVVQLARRFGTPVTQTMDIGSEQRRTGQIIEIFHARLAEDFGLEELAATIDCTPYHLIRFFKKAAGLTPHAYLIQLRLEKARQFLNAGRSIADTALETGFTDQSHLTRHFKTKFGIPPGLYRRQVKNTQ